jgi:hypothetical protein
LKDAGIEENDEHEKVIREIDFELFLRYERRPQIQHYELMNFEEEMEFLEEWLTRDAGNEDYKERVDSTQFDFEEKMKVSINKSIDKEEIKNPGKGKEMQQPVKTTKQQENISKFQKQVQSKEMYQPVRG